MENRKKDLAEAYRQQSNILSPQQIGNGSIIESVVENDLQNLYGHRIELTGQPEGDHVNKYFFNGLWKTAKVPTFELILAELKTEFKNHQQTQLNRGSLLPKTYPPELLEKKNQILARLQIAQEEIDFLDGLISDAEAKEKEAAEFREPCLGPKATWAREEMRDGVIISCAGQKVEPDKDGVLRITDSRSPYNGLFVWAWRSRIFGPVQREYSWRTRQMFKKEPSDRDRVVYPASPIWDPKTDSVEYPGYAEGPLRAQKLIK